MFSIYSRNLLYGWYSKTFVTVECLFSYIGFLEKSVIVSLVFFTEILASVWIKKLEITGNLTVLTKIYFISSYYQRKW
uniref:Putative ovule protein n=1 Tax=Solanum chacoense TaxID=4108 RepID=A0A0V0HDR0_SOLCH